MAGGKLLPNEIEHIMLTRRKLLEKIGMLTVGAVMCPKEVITHYYSNKRKRPMPSIQTVSGPIAPSELGVTLMHEHIMVGFIGADKTGPERWNRDEVVEVMLPYVKALKSAGGGALVDCTPKFLARDPVVLKRLSKLSGLHIIANTGLYKEPCLPKYALEGTAESLADDWTKEAKEGLDGTDIRPGIIKIAVNEGPLNATQEKIVRAAALTHKRTGLAIAAHTTEGRNALQELDILAREGVGASAFVWVHADAEPDPELRKQAGKRGAWIELDGIAPDDPQRHLDMIKDLIDAGLTDQLLLSQDAGWYNVGEPRGGSQRPFDKLLTEFVPAMEKAGINKKTINTMLVTNPAKVLEPLIRIAQVG